MKKLGSALVVALGGVVGGAVCYFLRILLDEQYNFGDKLLANNTDVSTMILFVFSGVLLFNLAAPSLVKGTRRASINIGVGLANVPARRIFAGTIGILIGFVLALLVSMTYRALLPSGLYFLITLLLYVVLAFLGFSIAVAKNRESENTGVPGFLDRIADASQGIYGRAKVLDTSAVIDGRIMDVMQAGFVERPVIVPEFVVTEMQRLADSSDDLKRARGRRGLELLQQLTEEFSVSVLNTAGMNYIEDIPEVDVKLVKLCQKMRAKLVTTDYNLNKVAKINDVEVMNVNDLANAIKPTVIPGEKMIVDIIKQGKDKEQGIAYLDNGTMVVVEDGRNSIGKTETITITSVIQTSAGKMIFGRKKLRPQDKEKILASDKGN